MHRGRAIQAGLFTHDNVLYHGGMPQSVDHVHHYPPELLNQRCVLTDLQEIVALLEREGELSDLLQTKIVAAQADKNPYLKVLA